MTWLQKECIGLVVACLGVAGCSSAQESLSDPGNIVLTGIRDAECVASVKIKISSLEKPIEFPGTQQGGFGVDVAVEDGQIKIPIAASAGGAVTVDDIVVEIPQGCAPMAGRREFLGSSFELGPNENREVSWDDFEEE
jgi:hypothetical protein